MIDEIEAEAHSFLHGNDEIASGQVSQLLQVGLKLAAKGSSFLHVESKYKSIQDSR